MCIVFCLLSCFQCYLIFQASENVEGDAEFPNSPSLPVTMRSPDAISNEEGDKKKSTSTEPSSR